MRTMFWWGNLREGDHLEDSGLYERIMELVKTLRYSVSDI
jgi:hypothetical protein